VSTARSRRTPTRTEETQITDDGQVTGVKPDTVHYVEMDEE